MPGNILFIGGTGRCGTTLLRDCLCKHPDMTTTPYKWRFINDPDGLVDFCSGTASTWSPYIYDAKLKRLEKLFSLLEYKCGDGPYWDYALGMWLPNYRRHVDTLIGELTQFSYSRGWVGSPNVETAIYRYPARGLLGAVRDFITNIVNDYLTQTGGSIFVDADTWNILFFRDILHILPEARLIHIWRDPIETVCSLAEQRWMPDDIEQAAMIYRDLLMRWEAVRHSIPYYTYTQIQYEDLVNKPEETLYKICDWIGIDYTKEMLLPIGSPTSRVANLDTIQELCNITRFTREAGYESTHCL